MAQVPIFAPLDGTIVALETVPDVVFAQGMAGEGVAIAPVGNVAVAPAAGRLTALFPTGHAFGVTLAEGVEIIVHVGLDTIGLQGTGFEKLATEGQQVAAGQPILRFDRGVIERAGLPTVSPVVSSGAGRIVRRASDRVRAGQDIVFIVEI